MVQVSPCHDTRASFLSIQKRVHVGVLMSLAHVGFELFRLVGHG